MEHDGRGHLVGHSCAPPRAANVRGIEEPRPVVVERLQTASGELVLRACGDHHEIILNGVFLLGARGRSERALVREAIDGLPVRTVTVPVARGPDDVVYVATARG